MNGACWWASSFSRPPSLPGWISRLMCPPRGTADLLARSEEEARILSSLDDTGHLALKSHAGDVYRIVVDKIVAE